MALTTGTNLLWHILDSTWVILYEVVVVSVHVVLPQEVVQTEVEQVLLHSLL